MRDPVSLTRFNLRPNAGDGHVYPRRDGKKARCGGELACAECQRDRIQLDRAREAERAVRDAGAER